MKCELCYEDMEYYEGSNSWYCQDCRINRFVEEDEQDEQ